MKYAILYIPNATYIKRMSQVESGFFFSEQEEKEDTENTYETVYFVSKKQAENVFSKKSWNARFYDAKYAYILIDKIEIDYTNPKNRNLFEIVKVK